MDSSASYLPAPIFLFLLRFFSNYLKMLKKLKIVVSTQNISIRNHDMWEDVTIQNFRQVGRIPHPPSSDAHAHYHVCCIIKLNPIGGPCP